MKLNYIVIPLCALITSLAGSWFTRSGMDWYRTIALPSWTPPGSVIGGVWTVIFILSAISALIVWNAADTKYRSAIVVLFAANALLNILWCYLFFGAHAIGLSIAEMVLLNLTTLALIILIWPTSAAGSVLLVPYFCWVCFATYLTVTIWRMNGGPQ